MRRPSFHASSGNSLASRMGLIGMQRRPDSRSLREPSLVVAERHARTASRSFSRAWSDLCLRRSGGQNSERPRVSPPGPFRPGNPGF